MTQVRLLASGVLLGLGGDNDEDGVVCELCLALPVPKECGALLVFRL